MVKANFSCKQFLKNLICQRLYNKLKTGYLRFFLELAVEVVVIFLLRSDFIHTSWICHILTAVFILIIILVYKIGELPFDWFKSTIYGLPLQCFAGVITLSFCSLYWLIDLLIDKKSFLNIFLSINKWVRRNNAKEKNERRKNNEIWLDKND